MVGDLFACTQSGDLLAPGAIPNMDLVILSPGEHSAVRGASKTLDAVESLAWRGQQVFILMRSVPFNQRLVTEEDYPFASRKPDGVLPFDVQDAVLRGNIPDVNMSL